MVRPPRACRDHHDLQPFVETKKSGYRSYKSPLDFRKGCVGVFGNEAGPSHHPAKAHLSGCIFCHTCPFLIRPYGCEPAFASFPKGQCQPIDDFSLRAATRAVVHPQNGSRTKSPGFDEDCIIRFSRTSGFCVGHPVGSLLFVPMKGISVQTFSMGLPGYSAEKYFL